MAPEVVKGGSRGHDKVLTCNKKSSLDFHNPSINNAYSFVTIILFLTVVCASRIMWSKLYTLA